MQSGYSFETEAYLRKKVEDVVLKRFDSFLGPENSQNVIDFFGERKGWAGYRIEIKPSGVRVFFGNESELALMDESYARLPAFYLGLMSWRGREANFIRVERSKNVILRDIDLVDGYGHHAMFVGPDCSVAIQDFKFSGQFTHEGVVEPVKWRVALGFIVSFGEFTRPVHSWQVLDALIAHTFDVYRGRHAANT